MGIGQRPILEALAEMDESSRQAAEAVLHRHEEEAAANSSLTQGCHEALAWLRQHAIKTALITRNRRASVRTVCERHGLSFDVFLTREDGKFKPDPAPLLEACQRLGARVEHAWMVGDGEYDVAAGKAAGIATVWVSHGLPRPFAARPWREVHDLEELTRLLASCLSS